MGATETLIQVYGSIGFTRVRDAHPCWRRATVDRLLPGDQHEHLDRVAALTLARAGSNNQNKAGSR